MLSSQLNQLNGKTNAALERAAINNAKQSITFALTRSARPMFWKTVVGIAEFKIYERAILELNNQYVNARFGLQVSSIHK